MQLQNNHWCKLKSTQISYLHWIINLQIFKNLLLNLILSHHQLQQTLKKYLMLLSLNWLIYSVTQSSKKDSILKYWQFYALLNPSKFANLRNIAIKLFILFGSIYICEQAFSIMNINNTDLRSNLTDVHLQFLLRISTFWN